MLFLRWVICKMLMNFSYYIKKYFTSYLPVTRNLNPSTIRTYKNNMLCFIKYLIKININVDELQLKDISFSFIENYIKFLKDEKNNGAKTINLKLTILKSFFSYLSLETVDAIDVCEMVRKIKLLKPEVTSPSYLTAKEIEYLLIQPIKLNNIKELTILTLLYDGALRVSELCNLKVENITLDSISKINVVKSKNNNFRIIPLNKQTAKILKKYIDEYNLNNNDFLFTNKYGKKYTQKGIAYILNKNYNLAKKYCNDNTMYNYKNHPHMLRHSKAIHLLESGIDLITIRDFLGHKHVSTTEIYARITDEKKAEILLKNTKKKPLKLKRRKKQRENLESWLRENY